MGTDLNGHNTGKSGRIIFTISFESVESLLSCVKSMFSGCSAVDNFPSKGADRCVCAIIWIPKWQPYYFFIENDEVRGLKLVL